MKFIRHFSNMDCRILTSAFLFSLLAIAGCGTSNTLYQWDDYQPEVYQYFKGENVDEQIITLEKNREDFRAHGKLAPPGFHAHLGMLYSQVGKFDQAAQEFTTEKKLFPESAAYIDFLMNKSKKKEH